MFTGLLPTEHGAFHTQRTLDPGLTTVAELFSDHGYRTYLWAANAHIQSKLHFDQGFDVEEHPWSPQYKERALEIVRRHMTDRDRTSNLPNRLRDESRIREWDIKAAGELAQEGLVSWLERTKSGEQPWFAFLNYMEAHAPYIPPPEFRAEMMTPEQVERSYRVDNRGVTRWSYTFGLHEYEPDDLEILGATYDATLLQLDTLLRDLLNDLEGRGYLDNTIVVLAADHGEHLGEHHMLDHQYALYNQLLRVPLVVHYPERFAAGRDDSPVALFDLFPTLLEVAGIAPPEGLESKAVSLLSPDARRQRLAEYPAVYESGIKQVRRFHPDFDFGPWERRLRVLYQGGHKFICATDGGHEIYDDAVDPGESRNLVEAEPELAESLLDDLLGFVAGMNVRTDEGATPDYSEEDLERLRRLGYLAEEDSADAAREPASQTGSGCGF
jgi:arylsulfatase A-like enzyme